MNAAQALELSVALTEFQKYIESRFSPGEANLSGPSNGRCITGDKYIEFGPAMSLRVYGERLPHFPSLNEAMKAAREQFDAYAADKAGRVYWRVLPEALPYPEGWKFYMRLVISDKPAKEA